MYLLVGLGNPGSEYENTRHNVGFMVIDRLASSSLTNSFSKWQKKFSGSLSQGIIAGQKVILLKPQTYMNKSGNAVVKTAQFYQINPENIIIFHDEADLALGKVRVRIGGNPAGHNGIKSVYDHMGKEITRVRIGIDKPLGIDISDYVLANFSKQEQKEIKSLCENIADNCDLLIKKQNDLFMNKLNS